MSFYYHNIYFCMGFYRMGAFGQSLASWFNELNWIWWSEFVHSVHVVLTDSAKKKPNVHTGSKSRTDNKKFNNYNVE